MKIHELKKAGIDKLKKRVGRGISAGGGKTAGRGTKGQNSRAGHNIPKKFEGGQMPLVMRLHKLPGFKSLRSKAVVVSLDTISKNYKDGDKLTLQSLTEKGIIKKGQRAKVLLTGELKVKVSIEDVLVSAGAAKKFATDEVVAPRPKADQPLAEKKPAIKKND
jgi:large subunit ribosomal protein L15